MGTGQNDKMWYNELKRDEDLLPCPHCGQPCVLSNYIDPNRNEAHAMQCRNERCVAYAEWVHLSIYFNQFKVVLERIELGYNYSKKVIRLAESLKVDKRKSPEFCSNCNSKIGKTEIHLPVTKINKGKEVKYCEIRIKRIKK